MLATKKKSVYIRRNVSQLDSFCMDEISYSDVKNIKFNIIVADRKNNHSWIAPLTLVELEIITLTMGINHLFSITKCYAVYPSHRLQYWKKKSDE